MFKNLKDKVAAQVNKTNQSLFSNILSPDSASSSSRDSGTHRASITSRDENSENNHSRLNSASSDISQTPITAENYVPPSRHFTLPSDIDSEHTDDGSDLETNSKLQKLLADYKNKLTRLKNAYSEIEHENDHIKNYLQQQQDISIKRQTDLREQIKVERQTKEQAEYLHQKEMKLRDNQIEELNQELAAQKIIFQSVQDEARNLGEKNTKLKTLLAQCKEAIKSHQEKQIDLITERDNLSQELIEKQTFIESMIKDQSSENTSIASFEVKEHFHSDTNVVLHDKEQLESRNLYVQQLETDLEIAKQQQQQIQSELKEKSVKIEQLINDKSNLEITNKEFQDLIQNYQETILKDQQQIEQFHHEIEILKESLSTENEQHFKSSNSFKIEYENLTNELQQSKQARDDIQTLLDQTDQQRIMFKDKYEQIQQHEQTDVDISQLKTTITKLQQDYDESLANCAQLTQKLDTQRQEHSEEIANLTSQKSNESDNNVNELQKENDYLKSQIELVTINFENTRKEQLSALENELQAAAKRAQEKINDLSSKNDEHQEEINRLEKLFDEQKKKSNQYENELQEKSSHIEQEFENFKSQSNLFQKEQTDEYNSLKEQYQQTIESNLQKSEQLTTLQDELNQKIRHIEDKQTEIIQLKTTIEEHEQFRQKTQIDNQQLLEEKDKLIDTLKQDQQSQINLHQQFNEKYHALETKFNNILSEKGDIENELNTMRIQIQTTESTLDEQTNNTRVELEQKIKELETDCKSYRNEIETLKTEIISLININEENTRRIDEFDNEKFNFEQEINEKDQQITERDEKLQEIELRLKQTQESTAKFRKALQKTKESPIDNEQSNTQDTEIRLRTLTEEYEQRLKDQEKEYDVKLKAIAKEMSSQIDEKEQNYHEQLNDIIQKNNQTEKDFTNKSEHRATNAEQRALIAEEQISKLDDQLKQKQLDHYRIVQDLQNQVQQLTKQKPQIIENFSQTTIEDLNLNDSQHLLVFEPTEVDYLKQIVLAYMTGTDRITMAKVICAVLRYTDDQKSLIIEHEKLRQSRWINSPR